jgi:hypothetical protein
MAADSWLVTGPGFRAGVRNVIFAFSRCGIATASLPVLSGLGLCIAMRATCTQRLFAGFSSPAALCRRLWPRHGYRLAPRQSPAGSGSP